MGKWLLFGGRLHREIVSALKEYRDIEVDSYELVKDYTGEYGPYEVVIILDTGLHSLREWEPVRLLDNKLKEVPKFLYIREKGMLPDTEIFSGDMVVKGVDGGIYMSNIVRDVEEILGDTKVLRIGG